MRVALCALLAALIVPGVARAAAPELIVRYEPGTSSAERAQARADAEATVAQAGPIPRSEVLRVERGQSGQEALDALRADDHVAWAEPNQTVRPAEVYPNDLSFPQQWGLLNTGQDIGGSLGSVGVDVQVPQAWALSTGSPDVTVAVIDEGITSGNPDFSGHLWSNPGETGTDELGRNKASNGADDDHDGYVDDVHGWDFSANDADPIDEYGLGHGNHVTGIAAATGNNTYGIAGVAWGAKIMQLRALGGPDGSGTSSQIAAAIDYAGDHGAQVVNLSLGGYGIAQVEADAMARHPNTLYVVAAGNGTRRCVADADHPDWRCVRMTVPVNVDETPFYPCTAPLPNVLCVAATDNQDRLASFSNYGAQSVDLAAPGVGILSYNGRAELEMWNGTSMATPFVTGAAALAYSLAPGATVGQVKDALMSRGRELETLRTRTASGRRLDIVSALESVAPPGSILAPVLSVADRPQLSSPTPRVGVALSVTTGSWSQGERVRVRWQRCASDTQCADLPVTETTYGPNDNDAGSRLRVRIDAANVAGASSATTALSGPVAPEPPALAGRPTIVGTARPGQTLTAAPAGVTGTGPLAVNWQWYRCTPNCSPIAGATQVSFTVTRADLGSWLKVTQFVDNTAFGLRAQRESPLVVVPPEPLAPLPAPWTPATPPAIDRVAPRIRTLTGALPRRKDGWALSVRCSERCSLRAKAEIAVRGRRAAITLRTPAVSGRAGGVTTTLRGSPATLRALRSALARRRVRRVRLTITAVDGAGNCTTTNQAATLRL